MFMNKTVCFSLLILELSKIVMYEFWYDYMTQKYGEKSKLCYMDTDFLVYKKQTTFKQTFQKILKLDRILQFKN